MTLIVYPGSQPITEAVFCKVVKPDIDSAVYKAYEQALNSAKFETQHLVVCHPYCEPLDVKERKSRLLQQILPELTGPHPVGYSSFIIQGPKEHEGQLGDRLIGVEVYAPTQDTSGSRLLKTINPGEYANLDANFDTAQLVTPEQKHTLLTNSLDSLVLSREGMPIIIFSHGMGSIPGDYRILLEEIASHGYVILNLHHPSSSEYVPFGKESMKGFVFSDEGVVRLAQSQAENIQFITEQIRRGNLGDLSHQLGSKNPIIVAGHSLGGAAQEEKALKTQGLRSPLLLISAEPLAEEWVINVEREWDALVANTPNSHREQISQIKHGDFLAFSYIAVWLVGAEKNCCPDMSIQSTLKAHKIASKQIKDFANSIL